MTVNTMRNFLFSDYSEAGAKRQSELYTRG